MTRKDIRNITKSLFESKARRNLELVEIHEDSPYVINAVVEIPKGCTAKYEYNPDLDTFQLDRCYQTLCIIRVPMDLFLLLWVKMRIL